MILICDKADKDTWILDGWLLGHGDNERKRERVAKITKSSDRETRNTFS